MNPVTSLLHAIPCTGRKDLNRKALERVVTSLEGGTDALAFATLTAAVAAILSTLKAGDEVLFLERPGPMILSVFQNLCARKDCTIRQLSSTNPHELESALSPETKLVWLDGLTLPFFRIPDIGSIAALTKARGALLCVDNSVLTATLLKPLDRGADLVIYSQTSLLSGLTDRGTALLVCNSIELSLRLQGYVTPSSYLGDFDSADFLRGLETLYLRMRKHSENALRLARALKCNSIIKKVFYPGLHPHHPASLNTIGFGGGLSFLLDDQVVPDPERLLCSLKLFCTARRIPGSRSYYLRDERHPQLVSLWVGLEEAVDLITDLQKALKKAPRIIVTL